MTAPMLDLEPVAAPLKAIVDLFDEDLHEVNFPDVNAQTLSGMVSDVEQHAEAVAEAKQALHAAQEALLEARTRLNAKAERALAYAQVFAEDDAALSGKISDIATDARKLWGKKKAKAAKTKPSETAKKVRNRKPAKRKADEAPVLTLAASADTAVAQ